jgi:hypothetical protein
MKVFFEVNKVVRVNLKRIVGARASSCLSIGWNVSERKREDSKMKCSRNGETSGKNGDGQEVSYGARDGRAIASTAGA